MTAVDVNVDAGEGYGRWPLGDDEALLPFVTSINAACGFHAGDPATMRRTVRAAAAHGVAVGAHPGYPDLAGFGRREMAAAPEEIADLVVYQVGAMAGFCRTEGVPLRHVKPHGALYVRAARDAATATAIAAAVVAFDPELVLVVPAGDEADRLQDRTGVRVAREAYVDLDVGPDAIPIVESRPRRRDPDEIARRAVEAARGRIVTVDGAVLSTRVDTICVHGDAPGAVDNVRAIHGRLRAAGVAIRPLVDVLP
ncbi:LamB/YcsF family protein [Patulibacter sp. S7RM1-6]